MDWDKLPGLVLSSPQCTRSQQKVRGVQRNVHAREVKANNEVKSCRSFQCSLTSL